MKILKGGNVWLDGKLRQTDIKIKDGKITAIGDSMTADDAEVEQLDGLTILPGIIDSQVHFRDPGLTHKEDLYTGSRSAALGGVTTFLEMPNTNPSTTTRDRLEEKLRLAAEKSYVNYGFFMGAAADNLEELIGAADLEGCCGIKIFLGSSTGSLLLHDPEILERIFCQTTAPIAVHSENEDLLKSRIHIRDQAQSVHAHAEWRSVETALSSTKKISQLARKVGRKIHVLHITTAEEISWLADFKDVCTVEVTPQHLTLSAPDCYDDLGTFAQMNPPIRSTEHQQGLWRGIADGTVDVIGSDHAPHTIAEKELGYPKSPSGMPGVQTILPVMLDHCNSGRLSLARLVSLLAEKPAQMYGLKTKGRLAVGNDADITIVDMEKQVTLNNGAMASRSGWTPFDGKRVKGFPVQTIVGGHTVMKNGQIMGSPNGRAIKRKR